MLAEVFEVNLGNLLDQVLHLGLILDNFSDVDNLLMLQEVKEVLQIFHDGLWILLVTHTLIDVRDLLAC